MAPTANPKTPSPDAPADDGFKMFYADDLVYKLDKRKRVVFGVVLDPEEEDDDDDCSSDDSRSTSSLPKILENGQVMVSWSDSAKPQICEQRKVHLMTRSVNVNDCVTRLDAGKETQKGVCKAIDPRATVQIVGSGLVVEHVAGNRLRFISRLNLEDAVALGDKAGRIVDMDRSIIMRAKCGATVEVRSSLNSNAITDYWNESLNEEEFPYYPGQAVMCFPNDLEDPKWRHKKRFRKRQLNVEQKFTVESVDICSVEVLWNGDAKCEEVQGDDIEKLIVMPWGANLALGDRYLMKLEPSDVLVEKREWKKSLKNLAYGAANESNASSPRDSLSPTDARGDSPSGAATNRSETDGSCPASESNATPPGDSLSPTDADSSPSATNRSEVDGSCSPGATVPVEVLCTDCRATVVWQDGTEEKAIPSTELHYLSDALVTDHEFFPGSWVVPNHQDAGTVDKCGVVQKVNFAERIAEVKWFTSVPKTEEDSRSKEMGTSEHSVYDLKRDPEYKFEQGATVFRATPAGARLGKVNDISPQGFFVVEWLDGSVENCWHQGDIELVPDYDSDDYSSVDDEAEGSWESLSDSEGEANAERKRKKSDSVVDDSVDVESTTEASEKTIAEPPGVSSEPNAFLSIDEAPVTHQYYFKKNEPKNMQKFAAALQREYKLLEGSLPAGVWVRVYGDRIDLLSVMIRGPEKTPYEDGLFLFDVQLCPDYPKSPPQVHFISYISEQLNPNLYVEGVVCVSLLGTWDGQGSEVWTPNSTLLQLIVSIQGLILVAEPHYNEAGHEKQEHTQQGYENSRAYNELVVLKLVQSMTKLLEDCPPVFGSEVMAHFRKNGEKMCKRIEGYCSEDPSNPGYPLLPVSKGLKLSLAVALQRFRETLTKTSSPSE